MKKKILFAIHRLGAGGAEKSLTSLLSSLPQDMYEIDLMTNDPTGLFRSLIPSYINVFESPKEYICEYSKIQSKIFWSHATLKSILLKGACILGCILRSKANKIKMSHDQYYNSFWKRHIPDLNKQYDVAISYMDGINYYVIDHVNAKRKILWCHNDYNKLEYVPSYDYYYYEKAYKVCTISDICRNSLIQNFPDLKDKFEVVENISSPRIINLQADDLSETITAEDGFLMDKRFKIVSIGRLVEQKGFDIAIDAARILKEKNIDFGWYIIGDGKLKKVLKKRITANNVEDCIKLIGLRNNPYLYIKNANLYVMPSRYEGKSIALDEAKILCKPIIVTKYPSVHDAIEHKKTGYLVDINASSIADGIETLYNNKNLCSCLMENLRAQDMSNEKQVVFKVIELIELI